MIVSQYFGHPRLNKNLGNQLFELAALIGLSKRYNTALYLPDKWRYYCFFEYSSVLKFNSIETFVTIEEPAFHCCLSFFDRFETIIKNECVNIEGFLQSEKYWKSFEADIRKIFTLKKEVTEKAISFLTVNEVNSCQYVAISVRRGDFVTDPYHYLLPIEYYLGAFYRFFPDKKVIVFSDDIDWCKENFKMPSPMILFSENKSDIEQLSLMSQFQNFIIANSTFSWWGAYLSIMGNKKVIRPHHHFEGALKLKADIKDHYPTEWIEYNYENDTIVINKK